MDTIEYHKLVRDKMPEIIKQDGWTPIIRILPEDEYKKELEKKLYEEYQEVLSATGEKRIEELSDMLEVMISLAGLEGKTLETMMSLARLEDKTLEDVVETSKVKKLKRGGFDKKIFLEKEIKEEK